MIELITGRAGKAHVDSEDIGAFNAGFMGKGSYILDGCEVTTPTANSVQISAGGFVVEGRFVRVTGAGETVSLDSGASSYKRMDLLVAHYKRLSDQTESVVFKIVKGTPVDSSQTPEAPSVPSASILEGNADVQVPFAQILIDGITPKLDKMLVEKWGEIKEYKPRNTYGSCNITIYKYKRIAIMNGTISGITDTELWTDKPIAHIDNKEFLPAMFSKGGGMVGNQWWNKTVPVGPEVNEKGDIALSYKLGDKVVSGNFFIIYFTKQ